MMKGGKEGRDREPRRYVRSIPMRNFTPFQREEKERDVKKSNPFGGCFRLA